MRAVILAGGEVKNPLTRSRAMPAVPLGSSLMMIDVPISNCMNAGINKMWVGRALAQGGEGSGQSKIYREKHGGGGTSGAPEYLGAPWATCPGEEHHAPLQGRRCCNHSQIPAPSVPSPLRGEALHIAENLHGTPPSPLFPPTLAAMC